jgi:hypothetical protein
MGNGVGINRPGAGALGAPIDKTLQHADGGRAAKARYYQILINGDPNLPRGQRRGIMGINDSLNHNKGNTTYVSRGVLQNIQKQNQTQEPFNNKRLLLDEAVAWSRVLLGKTEKPGTSKKIEGTKISDLNINNAFVLADPKDLKEMVDTLNNTKIPPNAPNRVALENALLAKLDSLLARVNENIQKRATSLDQNASGKDTLPQDGILQPRELANAVLAADQKDGKLNGFFPGESLAAPTTSTTP